MYQGALGFIIWIHSVNGFLPEFSIPSYQSRAQQLPVLEPAPGPITYPKCSPCAAKRRQKTRIDCQVDYVQWSGCSASCGGGTRQRWGVIMQHSRSGGAQCPPLEQTEVCNNFECTPPVDCKVSYGPWTACSASCGGGFRQRWGQIVSQPYNGVPCPPTEQTERCNSFECTPPDQDCEVSYGSWTACSASCGGGTRQRWGQITSQPVGRGQPCPALEEFEQCNLFQCDPPKEDCQVSYGPWTSCSASCGGGFRQRWGQVVSKPYSGASCPPLEQTEPCKTCECAPPDQDCQVSYGEWTSCSAPCGSGFRSRWGQIVSQPVGNGRPCPELEQTEQCNTFQCAPPDKDCEVSYGPWTSCSAPCGGGSRSRWGQIVSQPVGNGRPCPELEQTEQCNTFQCAPPDKDCEVSYGPWTSCSAPCGGGFRSRWGQITSKPVGNGRPCPELEQTEQCNTFQCAPPDKDCQVSYGEWTSCSAPCGSGFRSRWGQIVSQPVGNGCPCPELEQTEQCNTFLCAPPDKDCEVSYGPWTSCSAPCGGGSRSRWGQIVSQPVGNGRPCPDLEQTEQCNTFQCAPPDKDCKVAYGPWTSCSAPCGGGFRSRWGQITSHPVGNGRPCPELEQTEQCNTFQCAPPDKDCEVSYGQWTSCSAPCGGGSRSRWGQIVSQPVGNGRPCPELEQTEQCNTFRCAPPDKDCQVAYGPWTDCSTPCGGGYRQRWGQIMTKSTGNGRPCPELEQTEQCNTFQCAPPDKDCKVSYGPWTSCSAPCGGGSRSRWGQIEIQPVGNGRPCPELEQTEPCNTFQCAPPDRDCKVAYGPWTDCSVPCGGGFRQRWGQIKVEPVGNGRPCPELEQTEQCNTFQCAPPDRDCEVSYGPWTSCSVPCGGGFRSRWGQIRTEPVGNGRPCPELEQTEQCNTFQCAPPDQDCEVSYGPWSSCSVSCGGGSRQRWGDIVKPQSGNGRPCILEQTEQCNLYECSVPVDCKVSFTDFTECDKTCGGGMQCRYGTIVKQPSDGGSLCPGLEQWRTCNPHPCTVYLPKSHGYDHGVSFKGPTALDPDTITKVGSRVSRSEPFLVKLIGKGGGGSSGSYSYGTKVHATGYSGGGYQTPTLVARFGKAGYGESDLHGAKGTYGGSQTGYHVKAGGTYGTTATGYSGGDYQTPKLVARFGKAGYGESDLHGAKGTYGGSQTGYHVKEGGTYGTSHLYSGKDYTPKLVAILAGGNGYRSGSHGYIKHRSHGGYYGGFHGGFARASGPYRKAIGYSKFDSNKHGYQQDYPPDYIYSLSNFNDPLQPVDRVDPVNFKGKEIYNYYKR